MSLDQVADLLANDENIAIVAAGAMMTASRYAKDRYTEDGMREYFSR